MPTEGAKRKRGGRPHKYITVGQGKCKVHNIRGAATANAIKKTSIREPVGKREIQHGPIKGNRMGLLHGRRLGIIRKNIPHGFGKYQRWSDEGMQHGHFDERQQDQ